MTQPETEQQETELQETEPQEAGPQENPAKDLDSANKKKSAQTGTTGTVSEQPDSEDESQSAVETEESNVTLAEQPEQEKEEVSNKPEQERGMAGQPFVVLSAVLALIGLAGGIFTVTRKKNRKRRTISIAAAVGAMAVFLFTTGWSGFALADIWTIPVAVLAIVAVWGARLTKEK